MAENLPVLCVCVRERERERLFKHDEREREREIIQTLHIDSGIKTIKSSLRWRRKYKKKKKIDTHVVVEKLIVPDVWRQTVGNLGLAEKGDWLGASGGGSMIQKWVIIDWIYFIVGVDYTDGVFLNWNRKGFEPTWAVSRQNIY